MRVVEILLDGKRAHMVVEMRDPDLYLTAQTPHIPKMLFKLFPHLHKHRCENDANLSFRAECRRTELPHLFEHLVNEIQVEVHDEGSFRGETEWDWRLDPKGRFHVEVSYRSELVVIGAIRLAEKIVGQIKQKKVSELDIENGLNALRMLVSFGNESDISGAVNNAA